jgi:hypothetical protein
MRRTSPTSSLWTPVGVALLFAGCYSATACIGNIGDRPSLDHSATTCEVAFEPAPVALKRLNQREYANTVRDLLHLPDVDVSAFPPDGGNGFDTDPSGLLLTLTDALVDAYWNESQQLIARALAGTGGEGAGGTEIEVESLTPVGCVAVAGYANLCSEDTITSNVNAPVADHYTIAIRAYGVLAGDAAPNLNVSVDGAIIQDFTVTATADSPAIYELSADLAAGSHSIALTFTNDFYASATENRDIRVDWIRLTPPSDTGPVPDSRAAILVCSPADSDDETCARLILVNFVNRAWRRPTTSGGEEIEGLMAVFTSSMDAGNGFEESVALALRAALMAPSFIFRPEFDDLATDDLGRRHLDGYELASRLSYALWSTMPDDELFELAESGDLTKPEVLETQVERMLASPRATDFLSGFVPQWLEIGGVASLARDPVLFPTYEDVRPHMVGETLALLTSFLVEDKDIRELVYADYGYLNEELAAYYGIPGVTGPEFRRVEYGDSRIGGIMGQASVLSATAKYAQTSPVKRGRFVLDRILCSPPPPVPDVVPMLPEVPAEGVSKRQEFEQHVSDAACAGCHSFMDPLGFALDNFGPTGEWREQDDYGFSIDASGEMPGIGSFAGPRDMLALIQKRPAFASCLNDQLFHYMIGREPTAADDCQFETMLAESEDGQVTLTDMIKAIVLSDSFRATTSEAK